MFYLPKKGEKLLSMIRYSICKAHADDNQDLEQETPTTAVRVDVINPVL
jgi:hypothetical protein